MGYLLWANRDAISRWTIAAATALLVACGPQARSQTGAPSEESGPSPRVTLVGDTAILELPIGRTADNGEIRITFDAVTEDSRCPSDVQCVWAGNAGLRLTLTTADESAAFVVNSTVQPQALSFEGFTVAYRDLSPYPVAAEPTDRGAYVATISVLDTR